VSPLTWESEAPAEPLCLFFFTTEGHGRTRKKGTVVGVASRVEQMWLVPFSATDRPSRMMVVPLGGRGSCRAVVLAFFTTEGHGRTRKKGTMDGVASRVEQMWLVPVSATERSSRMMVVPLGGRGSCRAVVLAFFTTEEHGRTRKKGTVDGVASRVEQMWLVPVSAIERSSRMMVVPLGGRGSCRAVVLAFFHHGMPRKNTEKLHRGWCCIARGTNVACPGFCH